MFSSMKDQLAAELAEISSAGLFKTERQITTAQSSHIKAGPLDGATAPC